MKAKELISLITEGITVKENTCDTVKTGDPEREVKRVAITMFPSVKVLEDICKWGADMVIEHEPLYYDHMDKLTDTPVVNRKKELVDKTGALFYRYHDHPHAHCPDMIHQGLVTALGLSGEHVKREAGGSLFILDDPLTATELALVLKEKLRSRNVRLCGEPNKKCRTVALRLGAPAGVFDTVKDDTVDCTIVGEVCEWQCGEYVRDAAALGMNKSMIVLGHVATERDGMELMAKALSEMLPDVTFKYFDTDEIYTFI